MLFLLILSCSENPFELKENEEALYLGDITDILFDMYLESSDTTSVDIEISNYGRSLLLIKGKHEDEVKIGDSVYVIYDKNIKNEIKDVRVLK